MTKDINANGEFAVACSVESLSETLNDLERKDKGIWAIYDDDAMAADIELGEPWTETDEFLD